MMGQDTIKVRFLKSEKMLADDLTKDAGKGAKLTEVCNENKLERHTDAEGDTANDLSEAEIIYDLLQSSAAEDEGEGEEMARSSRRNIGTNEEAGRVRIIHDPQVGPRPERWPANAARPLMGTGGRGTTCKSLMTGQKSTTSNRDEH